MNITEIVLTAFIINLGITLGAGLYETRIVLPLWFHRTPNRGYQVDFEAMHIIDPGKKFWAFVTTIPLTLLTIVNLVFAYKAMAPLHEWWVCATIIVLLERIGTFTFFIPTAIKLQKAENLPVAKTTGIASLWIRLNYVRIALTLAALLFSLKALVVAQLL
jgi:hypothetical protein